MLLGKQIGNQAKRFYHWWRPLWPLHPWLEDSLRTFGISDFESIWGVGLVGGCSETAFLIVERRCFCKMCKITSDLPVVPWEKGSTLPIGWLAHFPHQKMYHRATRFLLHVCTGVMMYTCNHIKCMHYTLQHTHTHLQMLHRVTAATIANLLTIDQPLSITISSARPSLTHVFRVQCREDLCENMFGDRLPCRMTYALSRRRTGDLHKSVYQTTYSTLAMHTFARLMRNKTINVPLYFGPQETLGFSADLQRLWMSSFAWPLWHTHPLII